MEQTARVTIWSRYSITRTKNTHLTWVLKYFIWWVLELHAPDLSIPNLSWGNGKQVIYTQEMPWFMSRIKKHTIKMLLHPVSRLFFTFRRNVKLINNLTLVNRFLNWIKIQKSNAIIVTSLSSYVYFLGLTHSSAHSTMKKIKHILNIQRGCWIYIYNILPAILTKALGALLLSPSINVGTLVN